MRRGQGFTLVELLVVIAILVLIAVAFPLALDRAMPGRRVDAAAATLGDAVRTAQMFSAASGRAVVLAVSDDDELVLTEAASGRNLRRFALPAVDVHTYGRAGQAHDRLVVHPDGSTTGGRFEIAAGTQRSSVRVGELTGRVERKRA